ncbi:periplasmic chaperone for outer membrane proteins Skp [Methylophaga frappieri]|uniref:Periplasmic chaperone for outer membrane proteins Skp n=2 Tax=Methylophaga frappieri (strain ATCC BAA-2434 / DSM 25690 / JAM7) TaxID=754477 RepID=I1YG42_METFJ|nr:periplasmic chaperone for outer membrane proteins Skp [Methylophaga frappieri]
MLVSLALLAVSPASFANDLKVGVVNASVILDKSPQKERALKRLETEFSARSKSLEAKSRELRSAQEQLQKDAAILSSDERETRERKVLGDQRELKRLQDEYSEDLSIRRNEELRKLEEEIAETIVSVAEKENYDLVLYQGVIFASEAVDITEKVLQQLQAR